MTKLILPHKTPAQAVEEALEHITSERDGEQYGLYCEFSRLNIAMGRYFRFNTVNLFAGLSGHGKSYLINILTDNFLDYKKGGLNEKVKFTPIVLHFCFEMSAYNEILRSVAGDLGISYGHILSSEYNRETQEYNVLTDAELGKVQTALNYYKKKSVLFFETPGNIKLIYNTVEYYYNYYTALGKKKGITYKFIVNLDHTLLIETLDETSALELMANVGRTAIAIRKDFYAMVNLLGQLNNNIEDVRRITTKTLHYPIKSDIYAQGQLYNACDNVFVIHQPQLLKITKYGSQDRPTKNLIHLIKLKARHGKVGSIWLVDDLSNGRIIELNTNAEDEDERDKNLDAI